MRAFWPKLAATTMLGLLVAFPVFAQTEAPSTVAQNPPPMPVETPATPAAEAAAPAPASSNQYALPDITLGASFDQLRSKAIEDLTSVVGGGNDPVAAFSLAQSLLTVQSSRDDIARGLKYLNQAAEAGVIEANKVLGNVYATGRFGQPVDINKAIQAYQTASDAGDVEASVSLASLILGTRIDPASRQKAFDILAKAARSGDLRASNYLGGLYANGNAVTSDGARALHYFDRGIVIGNSDAILGAGDLYRQGAIGVDPDPDKALALYMEIANTGSQGARRRIADMFVRGEGVSQDFAGGKGILDSLIAQGDTTALIQLGDYYADGQYVVASPDKALSAYTSAAQAGDATGYLRLATVYSNGLPGVRPSQTLAMRNFQNAIDLGSNTARRTLADLLLAGTFLGPDPKRAINLYSEAAAAGDDRSALQLGRIYSRDEPYQADYKLAEQFFELAINLGNTNATIERARAYATGPLASRHRKEALDTLENAVASKIPGAAATMADLQLAGAFPSKGTKGVIPMLIEHARDGDVDAARYLLGLYRDGYGALLQPDRQAAADFLDTVSAELGPDITAIERIKLLATTARSPESYKGISEQFALLGSQDSMKALRDLRRKNAGAYVYVVQKRLADRGIYGGPLSGILDSRTISAFNAACEAADALRTCAPGPLTDITATVIGSYLFAAVPQKTS